MFTDEDLNHFFSKYIDSPTYNKLMIENDNDKYRSEFETAIMQTNIKSQKNTEGEKQNGKLA